MVVKKVLSNEDCEKISETVEKYLNVQVENKKKSDIYYNYLTNMDSKIIYKFKNAKIRFVFYSFIMYLYGIPALLNSISTEVTHTTYSILSLFFGFVLTILTGFRTKKMAIISRTLKLKSEVMSEKLNIETINGICRLMPNEQAKKEFLEYLAESNIKNLFIVRSFIRKQKRLIEQD